MADIDLKTFKSIDGDEGGTWAPSAPIVIGGSGAEIPSGAAWRCDSGGFFYFNAGSTLQATSVPIFVNGFNAGGSSTAGTLTVATSLVASGTVSVAGAATWANGSSALFQTGSSVTLQGSATISMPGENLIITDNASPVFTTPRTRSIVQPLMLAGPATGVTCAGGTIIDGGGGNTFQIPLTKLINGANFGGITLAVNFTAAHSPASQASASLVRINPQVGVSSFTTIATIAMGTGLVGQQTALMTFSSVTVDDSQYEYWLLCTAESGTNAQPLEWFAPTVTFGHITTLGQF